MKGPPGSIQQCRQLRKKIYVAGRLDQVRAFLPTIGEAIPATSTILTTVEQTTDMATTFLPTVAETIGVTTTVLPTVGRTIDVAMTFSPTVDKTIRVTTMVLPTVGKSVDVARVALPTIECHLVFKVLVQNRVAASPLDVLTNHEPIMECGGKRSATPLWDGAERGGNPVDGFVVCIQKRCHRCTLPPHSKFVRYIRKIMESSFR